MDTIKEDQVQLTAEPLKLTSDTCYAVQALTDAGKIFKVPRLSEYLHVAQSQSEDLFLSKIIQKLAQGNTNSVDWSKILDPSDHRYKVYLQHIQNFQLEPGTNLLLLRKENGQTLMVIPMVLRPKFLHHAHDRMNHSGITRCKQHLSCFWWEFKDQDIQSYVDSCLFCAKRKGNYGRSPRWDIGHCRRGTRPFEVIYLDFVYMPPCRGKHFLLTILDSFSRYFMAIPFAHDRAIDAARGLYQMFLTHREKPVIVSSDRGTHFTGQVFVEYCKLMDIRSELHCPWRPQSTGNLERQHRTLKNAIFILCDERSCQWLDILQEVVSNMNAMVNRSTNVSPHYIITGRHPSLNLPKSENNQIRHPDPASYGMKVNRQMIKVHKAVAIAAEAADTKMETRLNTSPTKTLNPGDKVLLYRPVSAEAKRTKLPWLEGYTVVKSNNMVVKIRSDNNDTCWVHRTHLRYTPDRPDYLRPPGPPMMIPVPVVTQSPAQLPTQLPTKLPQPTAGVRPTQSGSSERRKSKIPVLTSKPMTVTKRSEPNSVVTTSISTQTKAVIGRRPSAETSQSRSQTGRYPKRHNRREPQRFKDFVKY